MRDVYLKKIQTYTTTIQLITWLLIFIDAYALIGLSTTLGEKVFLLLIVACIGYSRHAVTEVNAHYTACYEYDSASFGKVLLVLITVFTGFSLWIFLMGVNASFVQSTQENHHTVKAAQIDLQIAKDHLTATQKRYEGIPQQSIETAAADKLRLEAEISKLQLAFEASNRAAISAHKTAVSQFWSRTDSTGIKVEQIMTEDCTPKNSPHGGGSMKSAATRLCSEWELIKAKSPVIQANSDPRIQELGQKLREISNFADAAIKIQNATSEVATAEKTLISTKEKLDSQDLYPPLFMELPKLTHGYVTPLGGVTVFFLIILAIFIGVPLYLAHAIAYMRMQLENGYNERMDKPIERPSQLGRLMQFGQGLVSKYREKNAKRTPSKQVGAADATGVQPDSKRNAIQGLREQSDTAARTENDTDGINTKMEQDFKPVLSQTDTQPQATLKPLPPINKSEFPEDVRIDCERVIRLLETESIRSLPVAWLGKRFGMTHTTAEKVRNALVNAGYARFDDKKQCIPIRENENSLNGKAFKPNHPFM